MQNIFFQAICRVGIFMICAQAMIHFRPQEAYEKYLKLLVSVMVLIQLFLPVGSFLLGGGGQEAKDMLEQFRQELGQSMADAQEKAAEADAVLEQMTLEELRKRLEEQAAENQSAGGTGEMQRDAVGAGGGEGSGTGTAGVQGDAGEKAAGAAGAGGQGDKGSSADAVGQGDKGSPADAAGAGDDRENRIGVAVDVEPVEPVTIGVSEE